ncbi:hypothetical protein THAOC_01636 [Thalassiosira oceanica]|uniref:Uncharacterized protein n=1 Tax=Thalassiosira oceanica TaxID=159749 RepID=K0TMW9_THAOC|nr:hypothetical protein THAOC_01636 [Thalassiosira oceanica]|eukprot:EJK76591.1 hypothetical protein THAOC_01636 [Thalassiosira oceanica]
MELLQKGGMEALGHKLHDISTVTAPQPVARLDSPPFHHIPVTTNLEVLERDCKVSAFISPWQLYPLSPNLQLPAGGLFGLALKEVQNPPDPLQYEFDNTLPGKQCGFLKTIKPGQTIKESKSGRLSDLRNWKIGSAGGRGASPPGIQYFLEQDRQTSLQVTFDAVILNSKIPEIKLHISETIEPKQYDGDEMIEVVLRSLYYSCGEVDSYGVNEVLEFVTCDEKSQLQIFYASGMMITQIALRPKDAVENELDVCIQNNGVTGDCSSSGLGLAWFGQEEGFVSNIGQSSARLSPTTFAGTVGPFQGEQVVLMNANEGEIVCLEPSFDKLFGKNGDLTSSRLQNAAFGVCEPSSVNFQV